MTNTTEPVMADRMPAGDTSLPRVGFLIIARKRRGFDMEWGGEIETAARDAASAWPISALFPETRTIDDGTLRAALKELRSQSCDALVVLQPIMGDGRLAPVLAQLWPHPVVFWATPERQDSGVVSSCSLVGTHVFASIFRQLQHPFELAYADPRQPDACEQVLSAAGLCAAIPRFRGAKVGLIGSHAPGFVNIHSDPAAISRLGPQLHHFGMQEFYDRVEGLDESDVQADVARVRSLSLPFGEGTGEGDLPPNSRYYLALRSLLADENLSALALRCWPELPNRYGHWPYLAMSRLADEGDCVALEGDVDGALTCLIGRCLGLGPGYISDWLEHDDHSITLWHPGHAPAAYCRAETRRLGRHFNTGHPLVIDAELAAEQPITLLRLWRCDARYHLTALPAVTAPPRRALTGAHGLAIVEDRNVREWFESRCHAGMPHHVTVFHGHQADRFYLFARLMGISTV